MTTRVALLDRDGTINVKAPEGDYVRSAMDLQLLPGAGEAIARLNRAGIRVHVVTNQRGIALGIMAPSALTEIHARLGELLREHGAHLDGIWSCPHGLDSCDCRKPLPGLLLDAMKAAAAGPDECVMVGDATSDIAAADTAGVPAMRISATADPRAVATVTSLAEAVDLILSASWDQRMTGGLARLPRSR